MGLIIMMSVGALFSGLLLGFRDLGPYLTARKSGVIARKGARAVRIRRDEDPAGFARLLANRSKSIAVGFGLSMAGFIGISLFLLALTENALLGLIVSVVYIGFALFAVICLIRGFATGRMFAFWGFTLFGDATLRQNPIWFWAYALINAVIVLVVASAILKVLGW